MEYFWPFSWILIPLAGILAGTFKEWLKFKEKQNQLGDSTAHLEERVKDLAFALDESERNRLQLIERIQNLETIVTSQDWDQLEQFSSTPPPLSAGKRLELPDAESESIEKAARLARRINS